MVIRPKSVSLPNGVKELLASGKDARKSQNPSKGGLRERTSKTAETMTGFEPAFDDLLYAPVLDPRRHPH